MKETNLSEYRAFLQKNGKSDNTVEKYVRDVSLFLSFLDGQDISEEKVLEFKKYLLIDHKERSASSMLSSVNSYLVFIGHSEYRVNTKYADTEQDEKDAMRELTLGEYYRLISTAEKSGRHQLSLMLQVLLAMGLKTSEIRCVTVESVESGEVTVSGRMSRVVYMPEKLRESLSVYVLEKHIESGPVFLTVHNKPIEKTNLFRQIRILCRDSGVDDRRVNPGCFRRLFALYYYERTRNIESLSAALGLKDLNQVRMYIRDENRQTSRDTLLDDLVL